MFYVINKSKIYSYMIAVCTVVILFVAAANITTPSGNVVETSANTILSNSITNSIVGE